VTRRTFLFDMDGTLLDSSAAVVDAVASGLRRAYAAHGLPVVEPDFDLINGCMGLPSLRYFEQAFPPCTVPEEMRAEFALSFGRFTTEEEVAAVARGETRLYDGVAEALAELRARGHRLLLFSNAGEVYFDAIVRGHRLDRFFETTMSLERACAEKVAEDKTGMVLALADDPDLTVVVGDRKGDVDAGRAAGARTVGCLYGFGSPEELEAADWKVDGPGGWLTLPVS
jgi:phosphoglycolate phosphatase